MAKTRKVTGIYAIAHFFVDFVCAYAVFSGFAGGAIGFLLYNFCAFALQMPMGVFMDQRENGDNWKFAILGILMTAVMLLPKSFGIWGCVILGIGNGFFHVAGGLDVMNLSEKAAPLGVFVSPGALGLYFGTILGKRAASAAAAGMPKGNLTSDIANDILRNIQNIDAAGLFLLLSCVIISLLIYFLIGRRSRRQTPIYNAPFAMPSKEALFPAILCFLVVVIRSYGGMMISLPWKTGAYGFAAVAMVVLGKTMGGFLADRRGALQTSIGSMLLAAAWFLLSEQAYAGLLALFLFNMTMPITLHILARKFPGAKGFSFGLLTFALFLGFLPTYYGAAAISGIVMASLCLVSMFLLVYVLRRS